MTERTIWKWALGPARNDLRIPGMGRPLFIGFQGDQLFLWCVVRPDSPYETHQCFVAITGGALPDDAGAYIGSAQSKAGIVCHAFMLL